MLEDSAKLWLAMDGLWFQAVEGDAGMDKAIELDKVMWEQFSVIEAKRIMQRHQIKEGGGLAALKKALQFRQYAYINIQEIIEDDENKLIFRMNDCRVQSARKRRGLDDFPCKTVGIVEYNQFARTIDPRIEVKCIACPPDEHPPEFYCGWEFTLKK
jgi:hypothetical protein